jgi:arginyl-tRNA synthetase
MNSHLNFDLDLAADQSEKNPVYYIQYAHARISNIIKNGKANKLSMDGKFDTSLFKHKSEITLIKSLNEFPEIMIKVLDNLEPQVISNYLHTIASEFHKFYAKCRVITDDIELTKSRLHLIKSVKIVLGNGLKILGIQAPEKM